VQWCRDFGLIREVGADLGKCRSEQMHALAVNQHTGADAERLAPAPFTAADANDLKAAIARKVTGCPFYMFIKHFQKSLKLLRSALHGRLLHPQHTRRSVSQSIPPEILKPARRQRRVARRVLNVLVAHVSLD
jgi:hypothetical protein